MSTKVEASSEFGTLIRKTRTEQGISQGRMAERLGITQAYLAQLEMGKRLISHPEKLKRIADALGLKLDLILRAVETSRKRMVADALNTSSAEPAEPMRGFALDRKRLEERRKTTAEWQSFIKMMDNPRLNEHEAALLWKRYWRALNNDRVVNLVSLPVGWFPEVSRLLMNVLFFIMPLEAPKPANVEAAIDHFLPQTSLPDGAKEGLRDAFLKSISFK